MAANPLRMDDTIEVVVSLEFGTELMAEVKKSIGRRAPYRMLLGGKDAGSWQIDKVATRRDSGGYDDIVATFRRVLV